MSFETGQLVSTIGIATEQKKDFKFALFVKKSLDRHIKGDWGDLCDEDKKANDAALANKERILSAYKSDGLPKIWIVTEADRLATTILFPSEY